jgi:hypothetical protein
MKNRKREICTSGSVRYAGQPPHLLGGLAGRRYLKFDVQRRSHSPCRRETGGIGSKGIRARVEQETNAPDARGDLLKHGNPLAHNVRLKQCESSNPVRFPPGRGKLATQPAPIGSVMPAAYICHALIPIRARSRPNPPCPTRKAGTTFTKMQKNGARDELADRIGTVDHFHQDAKKWRPRRIG